jgi:hypothetical protein
MNQVPPWRFRDLLMLAGTLLVILVGFELFTFLLGNFINL